MVKFVDFKCRYADYKGISKNITEQLGLNLPDAFLNANDIATLASSLNSSDSSQYCVLPLDPVLEAENIGAKIILDDSPLGPRSDAPAFSSIEELINLPIIDPSKGRMAETIKAVKIINDSGKKATVELHGPITMVNALIDIMSFLISWRKKDAAVKEFFSNISKGLCNYASAAADAGCNIIYFSDSVGRLDLLGPKFMLKLTEDFLIPFLKDINETLDNKRIIHLCPQSSLLLTRSGNAQWKKLKLPNPMTYSEACNYAIGKVGILGQRCRKEKDIIVNHINYIELQ